MDSVSQFVLGAAVGEMVGGRKAGNKALWVGALAGTIPDLDVIPGQWMETVARMEFHRGPSHSIAFALASAPLLGYLTHKFFKLLRVDPGLDWKGYSWLYFWCLFTHALLDCCTTWGTQLFWPFSNYAVAWTNIFVVDPVYTVPLLIAFIALHFFSRESVGRRRLIRGSMLFSHLYLALTFVHSLEMQRIAARDLKRQDIAYDHLAVRPAPIQNVLWGAIARTPEGNFKLSYISFLDPVRNAEERPGEWLHLDKGPELPQQLHQDPRLQRLLELTNGLYIVESREYGYRLHDLRFGRMFDWYVQYCPADQIPVEVLKANQFVFSYDLLVKDGRLQRIDQIQAAQGQYKTARATLGLYWQRVAGGRNFCDSATTSMN